MNADATGAKENFLLAHLTSVEVGLSPIQQHLREIHPEPSTIIPGRLAAQSLGNHVAAGKQVPRFLVPCKNADLFFLCSGRSVRASAKWLQGPGRNAKGGNLLKVPQLRVGSVVLGGDSAALELEQTSVPRETGLGVATV